MHEKAATTVAKKGGWKTKLNRLLVDARFADVHALRQQAHYLDRRGCSGVILAEEGAVRIKQTVREQIGGSDSDARLVYLVGLFRRGAWLLWEEVLREREGSAASVYILLLINLRVCAFPVEAERH